MNNIPASVPTREVLWNVTSPTNVVVMYLLFVVALIICANGVMQRISLWLAGQPDRSRFNAWAKRFSLFLRHGVGQERTNRSREARIFHSLIYFGFIALTFATTMVFLYHDLGLRWFFEGRYYLFVTLIADLFGIGLLFGVVYAYHRRFVRHPDLVHNTRADRWMLLSLALMVVQGFFLEALRIYVTSDPWALYSPIGYGLALLFKGIHEFLVPLSPTILRGLHFAIWWFHTVTVFAFIALIPYSKFLHILSSPANLYFSNITQAKGALRHPGDLEKLLEQAAESDGEFSIGVSTVNDLSWKQRLDLDACTSCGRCQDACPAYNSGKILSPKWLILDTRDHLLTLHSKSNGTPPKWYGVLPKPVVQTFEKLDRALLNFFFLGSARPRTADGTVTESFNIGRASNPLVQHSAKSIGESQTAKLAGEVMEEDVFWACTSCRACMEVCPVGIEHVDLIVDVRRSMALMDGNLPQEAQNSLRAIETRGNPFGAPENRADWSSGLDVHFVKPGDSIEVLYWVGCISAYDRRKQSIARSMVTILNRAGVRWGMLGNLERCTGDPARRLGEENIFQSSAKQNIELLQSIQFSTLVANCPHCFNTLKNEYPALGDPFGGRSVRVIHHTELLRELLANNKLTLTKSLDKEITFHDPCYLGRYNDVVSEPREVLVQLTRSKGDALHEMKRSGKNAFCCGAGGGHFWMDMKVGERVNVIRTNEAAETGAQIVATGCPFCLQMMEDGVKLTDREAQLQVRDIAELVAEAL